MSAEVDPLSVREIARLVVREGDVLVVTVPQKLTDAALRHLRARLQAEFGCPANVHPPVIVLDGGMGMAVLAREQLPPQAPPP